MRTLFTIVAAAALAFAGAAAGQDIGIGVQAGTTGVGAEIQYRALPKVVVRGTADWLNFGRDETYESVSYSGNLKFATAGAFADWHPFESSFLFSGGAYLGKRELTLSATPAANVTIDGVSYTPAEVGSLNGAIKMGSAQPFLGLGFDNTFVGMPGLGFKIIGGVSFSGSPSVSLNSSGGILSGNAELQSSLANERNKIKSEVKDFKYYPVLYFGLTYGL